MLGRKYKLLKAEVITDPYSPSRELKIYRIKALRDIRCHNVAKGDLGGYVTDKITLSHQGECWVGDNAIVHGAAITGNAIVRGEALIYAGTKTTSETTHRLFPMMRDIRPNIKMSSLARITIEDEVSISGNAKITAFSVSETFINPVKIRGRVRIFGEAQLSSPALVENNVVISGNAVIGAKSRIFENAHIFANAIIGQEVTLSGSTIVSGDASVGNNSMVFGNLHLSGNVKVDAYTRLDSKDNLYLSDDSLIKVGDSRYSSLNAQETTGDSKKDTMDRMLEKARNQRITTSHQNTALVPSATKIPEVNSAKTQKYMELFREILDSLKSYETDIVKIIKYPAMIDKTNEHTASMLTAKRVVSLVDPATEELEFYTAVLNFDKAFQTAEAHALKISTSFLSPDEQKKTRKAHDLFSIAVDNASTENEKVNAFKQGFKQLEGIILVPEQAVTALRVKAGIAELEV